MILKTCSSLSKPPASANSDFISKVSAFWLAKKLTVEPIEGHCQLADHF